MVTEIELEGVPTDFAFVSDTVVVILMSGASALIVHDIESGKQVGNPLTNSALFGDSGEFAVAISSVWNNSVVVTGCRGNYGIVGNLNKVALWSMILISPKRIV